MFIAEDSYGTRKRFEFCCEVIRATAPEVVLDVGCGTGAHLTRPLAETFPSIRFVGTDPDATSIRFAQSQPPLPNLEYGGPELLAKSGRAGVVIASEVLEHVEDPTAFLAKLVQHLAPDGRLILTIPNGYGPFEAATTVEALLKLLRVYGLLRRIKRWLRAQPPSEPVSPSDSLADSPHLSFFRFGQFRRLLAASGLRVLRYQPRTFQCGFGFDKVITYLGLSDWNARIADRLPPWCSSGWMFVLAHSAPLPAAAFRRGPLSLLRRSLNEACSRLDALSR
jgi:SAM-dependent methyltransferase